MLTQITEKSEVLFLLVRSRLNDGQGLIEYALIILLVILVVIGVLAIFGVQVDSAFQSITNSIQIGE